MPPLCNQLSKDLNLWNEAAMKTKPAPLFDTIVDPLALQLVGPQSLVKPNCYLPSPMDESEMMFLEYFKI